MQHGSALPTNEPLYANWILQAAIQSEYSGDAECWYGFTTINNLRSHSLQADGLLALAELTTAVRISDAMTLSRPSLLAAGRVFRVLNYGTPEIK